MKKLCALFIAVLSLLVLASCTSSDLPEGMQLVYGSDADGYYFYAPEEWTVSNVGEIKSAYASRIDTTSISFAEVKVEEKDGVSASDYFFNSYFDDTASELPDDAEITLRNKAETFGKEGYKADKAARYAYNYEYAGHKFGFIQILMEKSGRFYIFTYCAVMEERNNGTTYFDFYQEKLLSVIENFKFVIPSGEKAPAPEYQKDSDGYILISDKALAGFMLYVPDTFTPDYSSAIVSASHQDGSNVTLTQATATGVSVGQYWEMRKSELEAIVSDLTVVMEDDSADIGNARNAISREYTYVYNGKTYHVYQVFCVTFTKGFTFTYTASEENYETHIEEIEKILEKVVF